MSSMIKMQIIGHLGKDCIVSQVNGKNVIRFTIAHSEKFRDSQGNNQERTTWVDCSFWVEKTGIAPFLQRGRQIFVEGSPEVRTFTRADGSHGAGLNLRVREVHLLGGGHKQEEGAGNAEVPANSQLPVLSEEASDDLPF